MKSSSSQIHDLILTRLSWWIKGWGDPFPYSTEEIIRYPLCLAWDGSSRQSTNAPCLPNQALWSPPTGSTLKWNVDASVKASHSMSAIGGALRNSHGAFICVFSSPVPPIEINSAEILAIYRAIQISMLSEITRNSCLTIESDSANAVRWCNDENGGPWNLNFQLNYIRNARKRWLDLSIIHKGRASNYVADALAKKGLTRDAELLAWL